MKLTIDIFTALSSVISLVSSRETYRYEKQNFFGLGRRLFPKPEKMMVNINNAEAYPAPLPSSPSKFELIPTPYRSLYQGVRTPNDTRVFRRRFEYDATTEGHQVTCEGMFDCIITFLAVESTEATPVILRGGAGYRHFTAIVKAKAGKELKGQVRAYCRTQEEEQIPGVQPSRRFNLNLNEQKSLSDDEKFYRLNV